MGQFFTQGETGVANLANDVGLAAQEFDPLLLAETHFTQTVAGLIRRDQFLDAYGGAGRDTVQWTNRRSGALALDDPIVWRLFFHNDTSIGYRQR